MKKLPEVDVSFKDLYRMLIEPIKSKLLLTGIELKIFNHMTEPNSAEAVAEAIGAHQENTRLFLNGLTASDLVEDSPTFLGRMFTFWARFFFLDDLPNLVKKGPPTTLPEADMGSEEMYAQIAATMASSERACAQQNAASISELPELWLFAVLYRCITHFLQVRYEL